jgi:hypothetical protein
MANTLSSENNPSKVRPQKDMTKNLYDEMRQVDRIATSSGPKPSSEERNDRDGGRSRRAWLGFLIRKRRSLSYGTAALILLLLFGLRYSSNLQSNHQEDYLNAARFFSQTCGEGSDREEALIQLQAIMARHQELHPKYDGALAQSLLNHHKPGVAKGYAYSIATRVRDESSYAKKFTDATFLIAEGTYQKALEESLQLKIDLEREGLAEQKLETLYAYNLLRIAMLQQEVGSAKEEILAWDELHRHLPTRGAEDGERSAYRQLMENFHRGSITLTDYINARKAIRSSQS